MRMDDSGTGVTRQCQFLCKLMIGHPSRLSTPRESPIRAAEESCRKDGQETPHAVTRPRQPEHDRRLSPEANPLRSDIQDHTNGETEKPH